MHFVKLSITRINRLLFGFFYSMHLCLVQDILLNLNFSKSSFIPFTGTFIIILKQCFRHKRIFIKRKCPFEQSLQFSHIFFFFSFQKGISALTTLISIELKNLSHGLVSINAFSKWIETKLWKILGTVSDYSDRHSKGDKKKCLFWNIIYFSISIH